jgi:tryptophan 2,3-dioxygenase
MSDAPQPAGNAAAEAHVDFSAAMSYGDYLALDQLLACQHPRSEQPDELLFIIIHQATELWMKLALHELRRAIAQIRADDLPPAFKGLARVSRIQAQLIQSWDVLSTLTPADYSSFRGTLGQSSGFQSYQYRLIEFALGNKNAAMLEPHRHRPALLAELEAALKAPSLYDEAIALLARRGFAIDPAVLARDRRLPHRPDETVRAAWLTVYRNTARHWDLYELAEELVDLDDWFQQWRFRHMTTVSRIIGMKRGTGGTAGVGYLKQVLEIRFFPELWDLRTDL